MRVLVPLFAIVSSFALHAQTVVVVEEGPGKVVIFPASDMSRQTAITVGEKPHEIALSPDGRTAFVSNFGLLEANHKVGTAGSTISVIDVDHLSERVRFTLPKGSLAPHGIKLRPPKYRELFTNAEEGTESMIIFNADSGAVIRTFPLPPSVHNFVFNADGSALFAFAIEGGVYRIDPDSGKVTNTADIASPRGLGWTADHRYLIVAGKREIILLDPAHLSVAKRFGNLGVGQSFYPEATPDGGWILALAVLDGVLLMIDSSTGTVAHRIETGSPLFAALDPDKKHVWISNVRVPADFPSSNSKPRDGGVTRLDLATFQETVVPGINDTNGIAISPSK